MIRVLQLVLTMGLSTCMCAQGVFDTYGALIRSDTTKKNIYLCFTGHDFDEGYSHVLKVLKKQKVKASFFLTGDFIRSHVVLVKSMKNAGHFIGAHSDKHLLYCDWSNRDSLLHTPNEIKRDIQLNLYELEALGIKSIYFMPPYEWYNTKVIEIVETLGLTPVSFTLGTRSNADYTTPDLPNYRSSAAILTSIYTYENEMGMNGFHLLIHPGTNPLRTDKLYLHLDKLITDLKRKGYLFSTF